MHTMALKPTSFTNDFHSVRKCGDHERSGSMKANTQEKIVPLLECEGRGSQGEGQLKAVTVRRGDDQRGTNTTNRLRGRAHFGVLAFARCRESILWDSPGWELSISSSETSPMDANGMTATYLPARPIYSAEPADTIWNRRVVIEVTARGHDTASTSAHLWSGNVM